MKNFYRHCYLHSGGWLPMAPLTGSLELGDFCQIQGGSLRPLGNIISTNLLENVLISHEVKLNSDDWKISQGTRQAFSASEQRQDNEETSTWSKQLLDFDGPGSFIFHGSRPHCQFITNWSECSENAIIKLTQDHYSFREIYIITAIISIEHWALAIAGSHDAQLEVSARTVDADCFEILSHSTCQTHQRQNMEIYSRYSDRPMYLFKGKKLILSDRKKEHYLRQILRQENFHSEQLSSWINTSLLNRIEANELNISTCLDFFDWTDITLDDLEKLC